VLRRGWGEGRFNREATTIIIGGRGEGIEYAFNSRQRCQ
jgi:hypothetical protein